MFRTKSMEGVIRAFHSCKWSHPHNSDMWSAHTVCWIVQLQCGWHLETLDISRVNVSCKNYGLAYQTDRDQKGHWTEFGIFPESEWKRRCILTITKWYIGELKPTSCEKVPLENKEFALFLCLEHKMQLWPSSTFPLYPQSIALWGPVRLCQSLQLSH